MKSSRNGDVSVAAAAFCSGIIGGALIVAVVVSGQYPQQIKNNPDCHFYKGNIFCAVAVSGQ